MGEAKTLKFDLDKMYDMKNKLADTATDLMNYKTTLVNLLEELKKDWNTSAGNKFFAEVDTDWAKQVEQYVTIVNAVESLLEEAISQYSIVEEEVHTLKFY